MSGSTEMLQAKAGVPTLVVLYNHERRSLISHSNYLTVADNAIPNHFLSPTGDILIDSIVAFTNSPDLSPILRLSPSYAGKLSRLTCLYHLSPACRPPHSHTFLRDMLQQCMEVLTLAVSPKVLGYYGFIFNGLKMWHILHNLKLDIPVEVWKLTFKGLKQKQPELKDQCPLAAFQDLLAICKQLNLASGHDICLWVACCIVFWARARPGDVTTSTLTSFDPNVRNSSLQLTSGAVVLA
ncbi:hypothetical protein JCM1841_000351 [Sporobolomyces salmonicolor]